MVIVILSPGESDKRYGDWLNCLIQPTSEIGKLETSIQIINNTITEFFPENN